MLLDLECPQMQPARDPLRSFVYHAADRAVRDVFVDGEQVVADGRVLTLDQAGAGARLLAAQQRMEALAPQRDYRGRTAAEITPLSLPIGNSSPPSVRPGAAGLSALSAHPRTCDERTGLARAGAVGRVFVYDRDDDQDEGGQPQQVGPALLLARHVEDRDDRLVQRQQPEGDGKDREERRPGCAARTSRRTGRRRRSPS